MGFIACCGIFAFMVQVFILFGIEKPQCKIRYLSIVFMGLFPLGGTFYYVFRRPSSGFLGWEFGAAVCLWIMAAVLLGYLLAWGIYAMEK
ncbi:hypothetical protein [uncultured Dysosmobacter sp.]|uniref:hypothetical protein n=1 Tax=uncultured Dysosmobacter sp. TaxID=2591384 RepID=UPI002604A14C|nr:hypothetical protein [uncultured Dysosmobacter sp.]